MVKTTRKAVRASGGRPTKVDNLHMTLAFLGGLEAALLAEALAVPPIPVGAFELELDRLGYFARSRVLWLAPSQPPPALLELEQRLWQGLTQRGFERAPGLFRPHVTLARKAATAAAGIRPVLWPVDALSLLESIPVERGVRYARLASWSL